jgi:lambda repressor-like predicted transcriptional regulator|uniref:BON domain-containing protein n=1 Tax=Cephaloticoccus sp. TaxID=1985742 RepID=UPI0040496A3B
MKTALLFFLLGALAGIVGMGIYVERHPPTATPLREQARDATTRMVDQTKTAAVTVKDSVADKLVEWHLTPADIKADLDKTGQVVRQKSASAVGAISDARILAVIKAKFVLDADLSAWAINIDVKDHDVTLKGSVNSPDLIGKAIALSLDTDGVSAVTSDLIVAGS